MATMTFEPMAVPLREDEYGAIRVGNTRVLLDVVIHAFREGASAEGIVESYDALNLADVYAVISHVERTNRMFRFLEKVRYKWRRRKTLVRFVVLTLDDVWSDWEPPMARGADRSRTVKHGKTQPQARQAQRQVA